MANVIDPTVESSSEQASIASGPRFHGEVTIDLQLPADVSYDVDDRGDGRLVIQYWHDGTDNAPDTATARSSR